MNITAQTVLINPQGFVLGVSRKDNHQDFGLCGGKMEEIDNGDPQMTAIRETFEETGLKISNLRLVFAMHKDGYMGYTYLADYEGEINHNEPHVVAWCKSDVLTKGSFGRYNELVFESLNDMGVKITHLMSMDVLKDVIAVRNPPHYYPK
jgi:8-oxo-dGTP pyrophosphatase MutT (NUDIX family)